MPAADRREGADLVVVGASVGGLAAAITAADRGCQVVLVERAKELGEAAGTDGAVAAAGSRWQREAGVDEQPERLASDLMAAASARVTSELIRALAAQARRWSSGSRIGAERRAAAAGRRIGVPGPARLHAVPSTAARAWSPRSRASCRVTTASGCAPASRRPTCCATTARSPGSAVKPDRRGAPDDRRPRAARVRRLRGERRADRPALSGGGRHCRWAARRSRPVTACASPSLPAPAPGPRRLRR